MTAAFVLLPAGGKRQQRKAWFTVLQCTACPLQARCTTSKRGRIVTWRPHHELQADARRQATDPSWQADYRRWRRPVERVIAWLVAHGNRRLPCRGTIKGERWIHHRAAALNLRRLINLGLNRHNGLRFPREPCLPAQTPDLLHYSGEDGPGPQPQEPRLPWRQAAGVRPGRLQAASRSRVRHQSPQKAPCSGNTVRQARGPLRGNRAGRNHQRVAVTSGLTVHVNRSPSALRRRRR
ncbi:transposase [Streptomyces noursei]|uniref:transposase n=1 Tax=Streptomyces noursei TaxID=1971 RepID=UPI003558EF80